MDGVAVGPAEQDGALVLELRTLDVPESDIAAERVERQGIKTPPAAARRLRRPLGSRLCLRPARPAALSRPYR